MQICPLFAALPQDQQLLAFRPPPPNTRKLILATNIAETSVTINGIRYVIDSGWVKVRRYVASTGLDSLKVTQGMYVCSCTYIRGHVMIPVSVTILAFVCMLMMMTSVLQLQKLKQIKEQVVQVVKHLAHAIVYIRKRRSKDWKMLHNQKYRESI